MTFTRFPQWVKNLWFKQIQELCSLTSNGTRSVRFLHTGAVRIPPLALCVTSSSLSAHFPYSASVPGAWLVGGDSEWKDRPHTRELRGVPVTGSPGRTAELSTVSTTTADSSVVGHCSLPLRNTGWLTLLLPVSTDVFVNSGVSHPRNHLSWHAVMLQAREGNQQRRPFDFDNHEKGLQSHVSYLAPCMGCAHFVFTIIQTPTFWNRKWDTSSPQEHAL